MTSRKPEGKHTQRIYRDYVTDELIPAHVVVQETDILIHTDVGTDDRADVVVEQIAKEVVITQRGYLEGYIKGHADFLSCMVPWPHDAMAPEIVRNMIDAGRQAGVGPMAAVAGAMAEQVGGALLERAKTVIVENGGDLFLNSQQSVTIALYANDSPLSLNVGLRMAPDQMPIAVCTSSGTVGHSFSMGQADAVCVVSPSCALADATATAMGNRVQSPADIASTIDWGKSIQGVAGGVIIIGDKMGAWGDIELVPLG